MFESMNTNTIKIKRGKRPPLSIIFDRFAISRLLHAKVVRVERDRIGR